MYYRKAYPGPSSKTGLSRAQFEMLEPARQGFGQRLQRGHLCRALNQICICTTDGSEGL